MKHTVEAILTKDLKIEVVIPLQEIMNDTYHKSER